MTDAQERTPAPAQEDADVADRQPATTADETVELIGVRDSGPAGVVRLFEDATRDGRYVDVNVQDIVRQFPEEDADSATAQTVIVVPVAAVVVICQPVEAGTLRADAGHELRSAPAAPQALGSTQPGHNTPGTTWPRR